MNCSYISHEFTINCTPERFWSPSTAPPCHEDHLNGKTRAFHIDVSLPRVYWYVTIYIYDIIWYYFYNDVKTRRFHAISMLSITKKRLHQKNPRCSLVIKADISDPKTFHSSLWKKAAKVGQQTIAQLVNNS